MTCARCRGRGDEADEGEFQACQMCGGSGAAVPCRAGVSPVYAGRYDLCRRPSVTWDDGSERCHRHDPETIKKVREQVAQAREKVS